MLGLEKCRLLKNRFLREVLFEGGAERVHWGGREVLHRNFHLNSPRNK